MPAYVPQGHLKIARRFNAGLFSVVPLEQDGCEIFGNEYSPKTLCPYSFVVIFARMNRRLIFGFVIAALLVNLAIGAQIYLSAAGETRTCSFIPTCWKKSARNTWTARTSPTSSWSMRRSRAW
jgi:hypothetical protein